MGPPGGGRTSITQRYVRHFNLINAVPFSDVSLARVFTAISDWFLAARGFGSAVKSLSGAAVAATIDVFNTVSASLLPTPLKSHYTFNLRDSSKVFQGMSGASGETVKDKDAFVRLWMHECQRVFHDRLISDEDRNWFVTMAAEKISDHFGSDWKKARPRGALVYGNYLNPDAIAIGKAVYQQIEDMDELQKVMDNYLEDFNAMTRKPMSLVLFRNAIEHVSRISRVINQPSGHALLVGVGGSGRKSLATLSASIADFKLLSIEISKSYDKNAWADDLKRILELAGGQGKAVVFLFDDTQIVREQMVEDINGLLNVGEVANLFLADELTAIFETISKDAIAAGINSGSKAEMYV